MNMLRKPTPIVKHIEISLEEAYTGTNVPLEVERWCQDGNIKRVEREKIYVNVGVGIDDNEIITIPQKGNIINNNLKGDIKISVKIKNTSEFTRKGVNLIYKKQITLKEALTGFKFDLKHLSGKTYTINNQGGRIIKTGFNKVVRHMGMRRERRHPAPPVVGDLIIVFDIVFPDSLTEEQIAKLKEIL
jgi:DnaJ family protein A protein 2